MNDPLNSDDNSDALARELRRALTRIEPEKDFSAMVYPRVYSRGNGRRWMALAAAVVIMFAGVMQYQARQRRGEDARDKLVTALRITQSKLQKTRQMVSRGLNRRDSL